MERATGQRGRGSACPRGHAGEGNRIQINLGVTGWPRAQEQNKAGVRIRQIRPGKELASHSKDGVPISPLMLGDLQAQNP